MFQIINTLCSREEGQILRHPLIFIFSLFETLEAAFLALALPVDPCWLGTLHPLGKLILRGEAFSDPGLDYLTLESNFYNLALLGSWAQPVIYSITLHFKGASNRKIRASFKAKCGF